MILTPPTFAMYSHSAQVQGVEMINVPLTAGDFQLDVDGILLAQRNNPRAKLLFVCSPNNPTANLVRREDVLAIAAALFGKALVAVDELYLDYSSSPSMAREIAAHPNIVALRSMSKEYSLAGERFGITIAHPEVISVFGRMLPPYPLSQTAIRAVSAVMTPEGLAYARDKITRIIEERERVADVLRRSRAVLNVFPSDANFLLVQVTDPKRLVAMMEEAGIKIRDRSSLTGAEGSVRISIGSPRENAEMLAVVEAFATKTGAQQATP